MAQQYDINGTLEYNFLLLETSDNYWYDDVMNEGEKEAHLDIHTPSDKVRIIIQVTQWFSFHANDPWDSPTGVHDV